MAPFSFNATLRNTAATIRQRQRNADCPSLADSTFHCLSTASTKTFLLQGIVTLVWLWFCLLPLSLALWLVSDRPNLSHRPPHDAISTPEMRQPSCLRHCDGDLLRIPYLIHVPALYGVTVNQHHPCKRPLICFQRRIPVVQNASVDEYIHMRTDSPLPLLLVLHQHCCP